MIHKGSEFLCIPWEEDFPAALLSAALEDTGGNLSRACFIFPNSRPEKYLARLIREDPRVRRPVIMPAMLTVSGLFSTLRSRIQSRPAWQAGLLDRVGLLLDCARRDSTAGSPEQNRARAENGAEPAGAHWPPDDPGSFFPWGVRLANLYEECFAQGSVPDNFTYAEEEVSPFAARILARLGSLYHSYIEGLLSREWTTPGLDAAVVARHLESGEELPLNELADGLTEGLVYIAGFHALTASEDTLFRHLWQKGARVLLHADPAIAGKGSGRAAGADQAHWSCEAFGKWAREWHTSILSGSCGLPVGKRRDIRFYQGFDLHSQLAVMERELADLDAPDEAIPPDAVSKLPCPTPEREGGEHDKAADTVVVLPDSALLMPALHHLPHTDVNISMGYPLSRSPLYRLLDTILRLQENRKEKRYYWRDLLDLIRHPYLKMLRPSEVTDPGDGSTEATLTEAALPDPPDTAPLRREFHRLEQEIRNSGRTYVCPLETLEAAYLGLDESELPARPVLAMLDRVFLTCLDTFENRRSPKEMGRSLESLCALLLDCGAHLWERFLIDAECLFRIMQSLIPELSRSILSDETFTPATLISMVRRLMQAERVPFEAAPLVGLQVMGMLETRLLTFRRVIILEAGEHTLPGSPAGDPLLPEPLRPVLGLPALAAREQVAAYHFFRLLAGAKDVVLLWEESGETRGVQDQKKKKSRFIEELIWNEEKRRGHILTGQERDSPLHLLTPAISAVTRRNVRIPRSEALGESLDALLSGRISASLLDCYLHCPGRFYYRHLARLEPVEDVGEGEDPLRVGNLFHSVLQEAYTPYLGSDLPGGEELAARLGPDLTAALESSPGLGDLFAAMPLDSATFLLRAGKKRLHEFLLSQPPTRVLALETPLAAPLEVMGETYTLFGKADRIDLRIALTDRGEQAGIQILDYKTGRVPELRYAIWEDEALWDRLDAWTPGSGPDPEGTALLRELAGTLQSVQLLLYLYLYGRASEQSGIPLADTAGCCNAAWVELADKGQERILFPEKYALCRNRNFVVTRGQALIGFLLRHMLLSSQLFPQPGPNCRWCSSAKLCIQGCG